MRTIENIAHIYSDERGHAWIDQTNTKVIELVMEARANVATPEQLREQHPHLSLAQIHAALAYYYDHQAEIDAHIRESLRFSDELESQATGRPTRGELVARIKR